MKEPIKSKRWGKYRESMLLLQDNTPHHTAQVDVVEAANCGLKLLSCPLYSPGLAHLTSSCFLNSNPTSVVATLETIMKSYVLWRRFWRTKIRFSCARGWQYFHITGQSAVTWCPTETIEIRLLLSSCSN